MCVDPSRANGGRSPMSLFRRAVVGRRPWYSIHGRGDSGNWNSRARTRKLARPLRDVTAVPCHMSDSNAVGGSSRTVSPGHRSVTSIVRSPQLFGVPGCSAASGARRPPRPSRASGKVLKGVQTLGTQSAAACQEILSQYICQSVARIARQWRDCMGISQPPIVATSSKECS